MVAGANQTAAIEKQSAVSIPTTPIAYIVSRFPRVTETFILREILELEKQGQPVIIFPLLCVQQPVRHAEVGPLMPKVHYAPFLSPPILSANLHFLMRSPRRYLKTLHSALKGTWGSANLLIGAIGIFPKSVYLARRMEERGIRHIHAHFATHPALAALIVSELTGIGFSFTAHAHDIFVHTRMLGEKIEKARFVVTISEFNKRYLLQLFPQASESKIKVIRCGVELKRYTASRALPITSRKWPAESQPAGQTAGGFMILCVASLQPYKGLEYLIRACALFREQVSHFHCLVVGEGEERENLQRLIAQLGLCHTVQLLGTRPQDEVTALLAEADLLVLPSVVASNGQMEGIPVALMEAMASRLPVVATRLSGIPELVEHGVTGLLVPPRDERALADAMALLYERQNLRQELGERGREKVAAEYDLAHNVAKLHSLFHTTCDRMGKEHELSSSSFANLDATLQLERQLSERISEKAVKYFPDFGGKDCPIDAHLIRRGACHDSEVYEVILEKEERHRRRLILKLHRPHWANPEEMVEQARTYAQREYKALSFLWHEFSRRSTRFAVPKPLDYFPEYAALVLEKCQGETLDQALRWARLLRTKAGRDRLYQQAEACGEWLATFHRATRQEGNPSECYQRIRQDFHNELKTCSELGLDPGLASRVATWFDRKEKLVFTGEHAIVGRHCDFGPYNAFFSRDKITVIDFEGLQAGISYDDLCYFLGMVESMPFYHLGPTLTHRIKKSFLEGYSRHEHVDRGQLDVFMLAAMVKIMAHSPVLRTRDGWRNRWKWHQRLASYRSWFGERVS